LQFLKSDSKFHKISIIVKERGLLMKIVGQGTLLSDRMKRIVDTGKFENHGGAVLNTAILKETAEELFHTEKDTISNYLDQMRSEK
jgi:hypothetical protein